MQFVARSREDKMGLLTSIIAHLCLNLLIYQKLTLNTQLSSKPYCLKGQENSLICPNLDFFSTRFCQYKIEKYLKSNPDYGTTKGNEQNFKLFFSKALQGATKIENWKSGGKNMIDHYVRWLFWTLRGK